MEEVLNSLVWFTEQYLVLFCGCPAVHPFTLVMGCISVFNFCDKFQNMIDMETINCVFFGWASAILGRSTRAMKSGLLVNINYKESSLTLKSDEVRILTAHKEL